MGLNGAGTNGWETPEWIEVDASEIASILNNGFDEAAAALEHEPGNMGRESKKQPKSNFEKARRGKRQPESH
jgi:hypothetical protein